MSERTRRSVSFDPFVLANAVAEDGATDFVLQGHWSDSMGVRPVPLSGLVTDEDSQAPPSPEVLAAYALICEALTANQMVAMELYAKGHGIRAAAGVLGISPGAFRDRITAAFVKIERLIDAHPDVFSRWV